MSIELVEDKDVKQVDDDQEVLNVFVHSKSGLADAWTEAEVGALLSAWREVLEKQGSPVELPRDALVRRVLKRLKGGEGGFPRLNKLESKKAKDDIDRQMDTLRNEYQVFKGMQTIEGLLVYRHPCVDQLEHILDRIPQTRKTSSVLQVSGGAMSEDSEDHPSKRFSDVAKSDKISQQRAPRSANNRNQDEVKPRPQQRRMNLTRLVRVMVAKQQTMLEQLERLFQVLEQSSEFMGKLEELFVHSATEKTATEVNADDNGLI